MATEYKALIGGSVAFVFLGGLFSCGYRAHKRAGQGVVVLHKGGASEVTTVLPVFLKRNDTVTAKYTIERPAKGRKPAPVVQAEETWSAYTGACHEGDELPGPSRALTLDEAKAVAEGTDGCVAFTYHSLSSSVRLHSSVKRFLTQEASQNDCALYIHNPRFRHLHGLPSPCGAPVNKTIVHWNISDQEKLMDWFVEEPEPVVESASEESMEVEHAETARILLPYEPEEKIEYYSHTHHKWIGGVVVDPGDHELAQRAHMDASLVNQSSLTGLLCVHLHSGQVRLDVRLDELRGEIQAGEVVEAFVQEHGWVEGVVQALFGTVPSRTGYLAKLSGCDPEVRRVSALQLRRRFVVGDAVDLYRGETIGWVQATVEDGPMESLSEEAYEHRLTEETMQDLQATGSPRDHFEGRMWTRVRARTANGDALVLPSFLVRHRQEDTPPRGLSAAAACDTVMLGALPLQGDGDVLLASFGAGSSSVPRLAVSPGDSPTGGDSPPTLDI